MADDAAGRKYCIYVHPNPSIVQIAQHLKFSPSDPIQSARFQLGRSV
jgi:hypothetical protein